MWPDIPVLATVTSYIVMHLSNQSLFRNNQYYMNANLRKTIYSRIMAQNKFRKFGKGFWEENRRQQYHMASLKKKTLRNIFAHPTVILFGQKNRNGSHTILHEGENTVIDSDGVADIFNSLWPSDAIWWHRSGSTLAQVMACCRTAPSHYLNKFGLIISKV